MNPRPTTFVMPSHKHRPDSLPRIVLLDADVFFAPRMRDLFMHLRAQELIHLHWTRPIEKEWARNVVAEEGANRDAIQNRGGSGCLNRGPGF